MKQVQKGLANPVETKEVWYDGAAGQIEVGYCVCYDDGEGVAPSAGEFEELQRFRVVQQPETANLEFFAGVVVDKMRQSGTTPGPVRIQVPRRGSSLLALTLVDATIKDPLAPTNAQWYLVADAAAATATTGAGAPVYSRNTVALAGDTFNTSGGAANALIFGML